MADELSENEIGVAEVQGRPLLTHDEAEQSCAMVVRTGCGVCRPSGEVQVAPTVTLRRAVESAARHSRFDDAVVDGQRETQPRSRAVAASGSVMAPASPGRPSTMPTRRRSSSRRAPQHEQEL